MGRIRALTCRVVKPPLRKICFRNQPQRIEITRLRVRKGEVPNDFSLLFYDLTLPGLGKSILRLFYDGSLLV